MKIIVIGCGKIGGTIISQLVSEDHDVVAVDSNNYILRSVTDIYDVFGVCGNGADSETLLEAGANTAQLVVSVTGSDELNMLSCFMAKRLGAENTIARIRNPEYNDKSLYFMRKELGLSMSINPEALAAHELFNILKLPSAANVETFSVRNFEMIELRLKSDSVLDGMKIMDMRNKFDAKFLICAVQRGEDAYIPDGNFVLKSGDKIGITASPEEIVKLFKSLDLMQKQAKNIMILGGSRTGYYLAKMLGNVGVKVTLIERDRKICKELSELLPKATIIHGDGASRDLLIEEGLSTIDAFVALTGMDEENILLASYAQSQNVSKVIAKVNRDELIPLAEHWGLDCVISPKRQITNIIVKYARALENSAESSVETLYKLMDDKVEALEFIVKPDFPKLNVTFKELKTKANTLVAGIVRDRKLIIPSGDDVLLAGDKVVVLAANQRINNLSDILK